MSYMIDNKKTNEDSNRVGRYILHDLNSFVLDSIFLMAIKSNLSFEIHEVLYSY